MRDPLGPGDTIEIKRPKKSLVRIFSEPEIEWRAQTCTELLVRGWKNIRVRGDVITANA